MDMETFEQFEREAAKMGCIRLASAIDALSGDFSYTFTVDADPDVARTVGTQGGAYYNLSTSMDYYVHRQVHNLGIDRQTQVSRYDPEKLLDEETGKLVRKNTRATLSGFLKTAAHLGHDIYEYGENGKDWFAVFAYHDVKHLVRHVGVTNGLPWHRTEALEGYQINARIRAEEDAGVAAEVRVTRGDLFRAERERLGHTQSELAILLDVSMQSIVKWELNKRLAPNWAFRLLQSDWRSVR